MGQKITIKQNNFSHGMQSEIRDKNLVGQTQVFGAKRVKHFDIYQDANALAPVPSFERFNTEAEKDLGIVAVGGVDETVYGLGNAINNWYSMDWTYRVQLTPASTGSVDYTFIDLSNLSTNFWSNVESDGSDIRVTNTTDPAVSLDIRLEQFNAIAETGFVLIKKTDIENLYLYFGNANASPIIPNPLLNRYEDFAVATHFYTLDGNDFDLQGTADLDSGTINYGSARIGQGATNTTRFTAFNVVRTGDQASLSLQLKTGATLANATFDVSFADIAIRTDATGDLKFDCDTIGTSVSNISTGFITAINSEYYITMTYDQVNVRVYVNGILEYTSPAYNNPLDDDLEQFNVSVGTDATVEFITAKRNQVKTNANCLLEGDMFADPTFYTEESLINFSSITPTYSGIAIYEKDINGSSWSNSVATNGEIIIDPSTGIYPIPAFIEKDEGFFFLTSANADLTGFVWGGRADFDDAGTPTVIDTQSQLLITRTTSFPLPNLAYPLDKDYYFGLSGQISTYAPATGFTANVYNPYPTTASVIPYGYSLAMTGSVRGKASIDLWDLLNLDPETVISLGTGIAKVVNNINGQLITVVDNYLQNEGLSRGKPSLDFRRWLGQDNIQTLQSFEFENVSTVYTNDWQFAIDSKRSDVQNASVFHAEPKTDWKGMWAIGSGEKNQQLGVSILYDTEALGTVAFHHAIGNNLIIILENGEIYKINDDGTYTGTSIFDSMVIDAGIIGIQKDIVALEVILDKDLPSGQTITVRYSADGGSYVTVGTCTTGERVTEFTLNALGEPLDSFNELEVQIESSGGDARVTEYSVKVEYEEEVV